jgi:hypothetical protein
MPGSVRPRSWPKASDGMAAVLTKASITRRGERMNIVESRLTGQIASWPAKGSRMIELAKVEAALFGLPGRTTMVGSLSERPSMKPFRV